jgi:hypothetical protein
LLILHGCTVQKADALLEESSGRLRIALRLVGGASAAASEMLTLDADFSSDPD